MLKSYVGRIDNPPHDPMNIFKNANISSTLLFVNQPDISPKEGGNESLRLTFPNPPAAPLLQHCTTIGSVYGFWGLGSSRSGNISMPKLRGIPAAFFILTRKHVNNISDLARKIVTTFILNRNQTTQIVPLKDFHDL